MTSAICTLFEGDYHYGVGALVNSLYAHGFRGTIYAGFRGPLPPWAASAKKLDDFTEFCAAKGLTLRFIPLATKLHLTNYKPDFMLEVWEKHCPQAASLFYFDPDITIKCRWTFFEEWIDAGVAVCQDINPSMGDNHPIRHAWRKLLVPLGLEFQNHYEIYFNGGFVGLRQSARDFLKEWKKVQSLMAKCGTDFQSLGVGDRTLPFTCRDQDALNIACMTTQQLISPVGQDGMDFQQGGGGYIMSHSVGSGKPWNKSFVFDVLRRAAAPSRADKEFFRFVDSPIQIYPASTKSLKRFGLLAASILGRFVRNS